MITKSIAAVIDSLKSGQLAAIPTETVYGLAGNALDAKAVQAIFELKKRPLHNPLIVHLHTVEQLRDYAVQVPDLALEIGRQFWPGPLTILFEKKGIIPELTTAGSAKVAIRIPAHPLTLDILRALDFPLAAPSANPYQRISPTRAEQVYDYFGEQVPYILDGGPCACGIESTIIGIDNDQIVVYRQGSVTLEALQEIAQTIPYEPVSHTTRTSGMDKYHYAPTTPMQIVADKEAFLRNHPGKHIGILEFPDSDEATIARNFYATLHELDRQGYDLIIAVRFKEEGIGRALNDKLLRAASVK